MKDLEIKIYLALPLTKMSSKVTYYSLYLATYIQKLLLFSSVE